MVTSIVPAWKKNVFELEIAYPPLVITVTCTIYCVQLLPSTAGLSNNAIVSLLVIDITVCTELALSSVTLLIGSHQHTVTVVASIVLILM